MQLNFIRKIAKCNPIELLSWVSACQLPFVNKEKYAIIEYALGVLCSINYRKSGKTRKTSRTLVKNILYQAKKDFDNIIKGESEIESFFPAGFMYVRTHAFPWQFTQTALDRYEPHNTWLKKNFGFTINEAVNISKEVIKKYLKKTIKLGSFSDPPSTEEQYYDLSYFYIPTRNESNLWKQQITFSKSEIIEFDTNEAINSFLKRMTFNLNKEQFKIEHPLDFNILYSRPFIDINDKLLLVLPRLLWQALSTTFHYDILNDSKYIGKYIDSKGKIAETRVIKCLQKLFSNDKIISRLKYNKHKGLPDIDIVVTHENIALFIESTAKWITQDAKKGDLYSILKDLKSSIEKCSLQLSRAYDAYKNGLIKDLSVDTILPIIVIDDPIPQLELILKYCDVIKEPKPYVIDTYDLEIITDIITGPELLHFISERIKVSEYQTIFASDELDYFVLYRLRGLMKYAKELQEKGSELYYIGHLENIRPNYYKEKFHIFIDEPVLVNQLESSQLLQGFGWS